MKRIGLLGSIGALGVTLGVLLALPAAGATTGAFSGVVVAKNVQRHTLVVASTTGIVRTVRLGSLRERVGARRSAQTRGRDGVIALATSTWFGSELRISEARCLRGPGTRLRVARAAK